MVVIFEFSQSANHLVARFGEMVTSRTMTKCFIVLEKWGANPSTNWSQHEQMQTSSGSACQYTWLSFFYPQKLRFSITFSMRK